jgi:hypothetical protein
MASKVKTRRSIRGIGNDFRTTRSTIEYRLRWETMMQVEEQLNPNLEAEREALFDACGLIRDDGVVLCIVTLEPATSWDHAFTLKQGFGWGVNNIIPLCEQINRHEKDAKDIDAFLAEHGAKYPGAAERVERFFELAGGRPKRVSPKIQEWVTARVASLMAEVETTDWKAMVA